MLKDNNSQGLSQQIPQSSIFKALRYIICIVQSTFSFFHGFIQNYSSITLAMVAVGLESAYYDRQDLPFHQKQSDYLLIHDRGMRTYNGCFLQTSLEYQVLNIHQESFGKKLSQTYSQTSLYKLNTNKLLAIIIIRYYQPFGSSGCE